ncbi:putative clathrin assembly protein [Sesamum angolense]|uniref:Clathrin assembly protein n=1 Tax=Sesamum angolense TaxID=2727404 RepID=A0AAE2BW90_9LAMI|nr:putative clathrin assembly protein [Sesamum angolense]
MRLWKRASGALKDQNSIWQAQLSRRTALRHPDIQKAVIRATAHYHLSFDRRNIDRVCEWIRISPCNLRPVLWSLSNRMHKTRNWVVALKGLYLMHNITNSRLHCVRHIGRLPFDLSGFSDGQGRQAKMWPFNAFIRAYYSFLDQKSAVICQQAEEKSVDGEGFSIRHELMHLLRLQSLIDLLMQIRPQATAAFMPLVLDVMDGLIIEIYDLYSKICRGIAIVLLNIYSGGKAEASMALNVVQKAIQHGDDLSYYFEFCQKIGVVYASQFPVIDRIPEEGINELKEIIKSFAEGSHLEESRQDEGRKGSVDQADGKNHTSIHEEEKSNFYGDDEFRTIITDKWESFDDDFMYKNPFGSPFLTYVQGSKHQEVPDMISFL